MERLKRRAKARIKLTISRARQLVTAAKPGPRGVALGVMVIGGATTAVGVGLIFTPAGIILAGLELTVFALEVLDVDPGGQ